MKARQFSLALGAMFLMAATLVTAQDARQGDGIGSPNFETDHSVTNFSATAQTIPYFRSSFTDPTNGVTYAYTMVGTNPAKGDATTTVKTVIIPMRFTFTQAPAGADATLDGSTKTALTIQSPVFQNADIGLAASTTASAAPTAPGVAPDPRYINEPSDVTQVGDAIYRAQWGKSNSGYHVLLGQPTVLPTVSYTVPSNLGYMIVGSVSKRRIGLMDNGWFSNRLQETLRAYHVPPDVLPIFLVYNTFLYRGSSCCTLGYHGATTSLNGKGQQLVNTYMFASYSDRGIFAANTGDAFSYISDIHALSHEVSEWYDDPFVNNRVQPWLTPTAPQYGCTSYLETGDPVVGYGFTVSLNGTDYHPEDEVHSTWFAREKPSTSEQGYYTYLNNFADRAHGCN